MQCNAIIYLHYQVSVCLQLPSGARLTGSFPVTATLGQLLDRWGEEVGAAAEGEEPVLVYMRREVVGRAAMEAVTLKTLGLLQGTGLFRFFYKRPEQLRVQANVYDIKVQEKTPAPEVRHVPMRLDPDNRAEAATAAAEMETSEQDTVTTCDNATSSTTNNDPNSVGSIQSGNGELQKRTSVTKQSLSDKMEMETESSNEMSSAEVPDSTQPEPVINFVGPNDAIIFSALDVNPQYQDIDDDFFELSLDEVKSMYKDLKQEVKRLEEGDMLMTREMRESQKEGEKLSMLSKYKSCVIRIQFPCRHVVQGMFGPDTKVSEVLAWLAPLLRTPGSPAELYTAPPRTPLPPAASLLDLDLFPAALVHFASLDPSLGGRGGSLLAEESLASVSNIAGANSVASQARRRAPGPGPQARQDQAQTVFPAPSSASSRYTLCSR